MINPQEEAILDAWQRETDLATPDLYNAYWLDGDTRGVASLEKLETAFENIVREAGELTVGDVPAVWSVYNMGYLVKTRESFFSIDLVHRRAAELAPLLDFALITHNHNDHWRQDFYGAMNGSGKTVVSNFLDNYGVADWRADGGFTPAERQFKIRDVEIRTSLIDHNDYLVDFTTAFEIKVGDFILYHTGDSGRGTEEKLGTVTGRPDLWLFFPGCGIDVARAVEIVNSKRIVFGHLWELGHKTGRLTAPLIRNALCAARGKCPDVSFALWGDRIV
jgi:L-ascorbate metabolism protein UlaG (beta-lactamase superfamily)